MINVNDIYQPTPWMGEVTCDLYHLRGELEHDEVNLNPPYQRGSKWTQEQQENFMGHMLSGGDLMPVVFQRVPDMGKAECLDGKQRLEAMLAWVDEKIPARLPDGRLVFKHDLTGPLSRVSFRIKYVNLPFEKRKQFYVRFNSAGTPHTREELEAALAAKEK